MICTFAIAIAALYVLAVGHAHHASIDHTWLRSETRNISPVSISPLVLEVFYGALPYTSDDNLIDFASFIMKEFSEMNKNNPDDFSINPEKARPAVLMAVSKRYEELSAEEKTLKPKF